MSDYNSLHMVGKVSSPLRFGWSGKCPLVNLLNPSACGWPLLGLGICVLLYCKGSGKTGDSRETTRISLCKNAHFRVLVCSADSVEVTGLYIFQEQRVFQVRFLSFPWKITAWYSFREPRRL